MKKLSTFAALVFLIGAVASLKASPVVYGVEAYNSTPHVIGNGPTTTSGGRIFAIDTVTGSSTLVGQTDPGSNSGNIFSPNSLAHDTQNNLLYYSAYTTDGSPNALFSYDLSTNQNRFVGNLTSTDATGAFYNGSYYYIAQGGSDVMQVNFAANGLISNIVDHPVLGAPAGGWNFGDIAIRSDGILFGSGAASSDNDTKILFEISLNTATPTYQLISTEVQPSGYQLAFDGNTLYGLATATGDLYELNYLVGSQTFVSHANFLGDFITINDMADGLPANAVPEPATCAMVLFGAGAILAARRRSS